MALPDDEILLLHNPHCSKSRATRQILEEAGVAYTERLYLEDPLSRAELDDLRGRLGRPAAEWVRKGEDAFQAAGLGADSDEGALLDAMVREPILMERPIVVRGRRAVVGRPPESVKDLIG